MSYDQLQGMGLDDLANPVHFPPPPTITANPISSLSSILTHEHALAGN